MGGGRQSEGFNLRKLDALRRVLEGTRIKAVPACGLQDMKIGEDS